ARKVPVKMLRRSPLPKRASTERQATSLRSARNCSRSTGPPRSNVFTSRAIHARPGPAHAAKAAAGGADLDGAQIVKIGECRNGRGKTQQRHQKGAFSGFHVCLQSQTPKSAVVPSQQDTT